MSCWIELRELQGFICMSYVICMGCVWFQRYCWSDSGWLLWNYALGWVKKRRTNRKSLPLCCGSLVTHGKEKSSCRSKQSLSMWAPLYCIIFITTIESIKMHLFVLHCIEVSFWPVKKRAPVVANNSLSIWAPLCCLHQFHHHNSE